MGYVPCSTEEVERVCAKLTERYAWTMESNQLLSQLQADALAEGYRLVNPRFEWVQTGGKPPFDDKARHIVIDGVERSSHDSQSEVP